MAVEREITRGDRIFATLAIRSSVNAIGEVFLVLVTIGSGVLFTLHSGNDGSDEAKGTCTSGKTAVFD
jgi:hypothetical protein